jgi:hypothetical protein
MDITSTLYHYNKLRSIINLALLRVCSLVESINIRTALNDYNIDIALNEYLLSPGVSHSCNIVDGDDIENVKNDN